MRSQKGNIAVYVAVTVTAIMFLLLASMEMTISAYSVALGWDVRRQREIEARSVAQIVKEAILATAETSPSPSSDSLSDEVASRISAAWPSASLTITDSTNYAAVTVPTNPQWPLGVPHSTATLDFTASSGRGLGRNIQALLSPGQIADLGSSTFSFEQENAATPGETTPYRVVARYFSVPLTNYSWVAYGDPSTTGGVVATPPTPPTFTRASGFSSPIVHAHTAGQSSTFSDMYPGMTTGTTSDTLSSFYRDLVSVTWNAYAYWTSGTYQNTLQSFATSNSCAYSFAAPSTIPTGANSSITWDGTRAVLNLSVAATPSLIVFSDPNGGNTLRITGSASGTINPVMVVIRNYSSTRTIIELSGNNTRPVFIYAPNTRINPLTAGLVIRGGVLLFPNSQIGSAFSLSGSVAYPQSFSPTPPITVTPDATFKTAFANMAPRALVVSVRGTLP